MIKFFQIFGGIELVAGAIGFLAYYSITENFLFSIMFLLAGLIFGMTFLAIAQILQNQLGLSDYLLEIRAAIKYPKENASS